MQAGRHGVHSATRRAGAPELQLHGCGGATGASLCPVVRSDTAAKRGVGAHLQPVICLGHKHRVQRTSVMHRLKGAARVGVPVVKCWQGPAMHALQDQQAPVDAIFCLTRPAPVTTLCCCPGPLALLATAGASGCSAGSRRPGILLVRVRV